MIGRKNEIKILNEAYESEDSQFVAIYGRRRVGKTFLVNEMFGGRYDFQHTGVEKVGTKEQLAYFRDSLIKYGYRSCPRLRNWREAFFHLERCLESKDSLKKVIFFDEVPWLDTPKSSFLPAFEHFWNGWACLRKDVLLIICGSATSWVVNKVLSARGGLHNRVTVPMPISPFSLRECEEYAHWKRLPFNREQIVECYMALGGVAYYWSLLSSQLSAAQNIDRLYFAKGAPLAGEFERLFSSLFKYDARYVEIVTILASRGRGMTRDEILVHMSPPCGGEVSRYLRELEECGFISRMSVIGAVKKGSIYRLIDNFVLFHQTFAKARKGNDSSYWVTSYETPKILAWRGLSFERICLWHTAEIKRALGIAGVRADVYSWRAKADAGFGEDAQIDILIDRADRTITICELKFSEREFAFTREESARLLRRGAVLREATGTRKAISYALVTTLGLRRNEHAGMIGAVVTLDDLFA